MLFRSNRNSGHVFLDLPEQLKPTAIRQIDIQQDQGYTAAKQDVYKSQALPRRRPCTLHLWLHTVFPESTPPVYLRCGVPGAAVDIFHIVRIGGGDRVSHLGVVFKIGQITEMCIRDRYYGGRVSGYEYGTV